MKATDPSRSRIKRALHLMRKAGTFRDGCVYGSKGIDADRAIELLKILNPIPRLKR
jgi:hypothetical protein